MEKLKLYCMYDKKNQFYHSLGTGVDDKDFSNYLVSQLDSIYNGLKDNQVSNFVAHIREQKIVRLGYLDPESGELISDKTDLVDLANFRLKPVQVESEVDENGEVQESIHQ